MQLDNVPDQRSFCRVICLPFFASKTFLLRKVVAVCAGFHCMCFHSTNFELIFDYPFVPSVTFLDLLNYQKKLWKCNAENKWAKV